jgi:hypothetical protein
MSRFPPRSSPEHGSPRPPGPPHLRPAVPAHRPHRLLRVRAVCPPAPRRQRQGRPWHRPWWAARPPLSVGDPQVVEPGSPPGVWRPIVEAVPASAALPLLHAEAAQPAAVPSPAEHLPYWMRVQERLELRVGRKALLRLAACRRRVRAEAPRENRAPEPSRKWHIWRPYPDL